MHGWSYPVQLGPGAGQVRLQGLTAVVTEGFDRMQEDRAFAREWDPDREWRETEEFSRQSAVKGFHTVVQQLPDNSPGGDTDPLRNAELWESLSHQLHRQHGTKLALAQSDAPARNYQDARYPRSGPNAQSIRVQFRDTKTTESIELNSAIKSSMEKLGKEDESAGRPLAAHLAGGRAKFSYHVVAPTPDKHALQTKLDRVVDAAAKTYLRVKDTDSPTAALFPRERPVQQGSPAAKPKAPNRPTRTGDRHRPGTRTERPYTQGD